VIRRSVARAFGPTAGKLPQAEGQIAAPRPSSRITAVHQVFIELHAALDRALAPLPVGALPGGSAPPPTPRKAATRLSRPLPRPEGIEFVLDLPGESYRFLDTLDGIVWIYRGERGEFVEHSLLTVVFEGASMRLIERPAGAARAQFEFTSVTQLAKKYVG